jgi:hypothetical protein
MNRSTSPGPTAEAQLRFLQRIGRILDEGRFTTTYKFALLIALTNIAVRIGHDDDATLDVLLDELAREFIDLHWSMARPYPGLGGGMLRFGTHSTGTAAVISAIAPHAGAARASHAHRIEHRPSEVKLMATVRRTITRDVLYRLQALGPAQAGAEDTVQFLYRHPPDAAGCGALEHITLRPGVAACLRSLRQVIVAMVQARWAQWMREHNDQLGPDRNLEAFMFGTSRIPLAHHAAWLHELQNGRCFYTGTRLRSPADTAVDHFLPRARYVLDEPYNLVLAAKSVNGDKSDCIASARHLAAWSRRNAELRRGGAGWPADAPRAGQAQPGWHIARAVAGWLYAIAERDGLSVWDAPGKLAPLDAGWRGALWVDAA